MRSLGNYLCSLHEQLDSKRSFAHIQNCVQFSLVCLTAEASLCPLLNCHQEALEMPDSAVLPRWESQTSRSVIALAWWQMHFDSPLGRCPKRTLCVWTFCEPLESQRQKAFLMQRNIWANFFCHRSMMRKRGAKEMVGERKNFGLPRDPRLAHHISYGFSLDFWRYTPHCRDFSIISLE